MQGMPGWMKWTVALIIGFAIIVVGFRWAGPLLTAFFVMNCLVLMIVVLLQSGKAADLAGDETMRCKVDDPILLERHGPDQAACVSRAAAVS